MTATRTAWLVHAGEAGFAVQCEGLAAALGLDARTLAVSPGRPHRWLAPWGPAAADAQFRPPWPDIAIGSARQAVPYMRRLAKSGVFTIFLQNPKVNPGTFDLVWAPAHDQLSGTNVLTTTLSPHLLTPAKLSDAAAKFASNFSHLPSPRLGVVVGGNNSVFSLGETEIKQLAADLRHLVEANGVGLIVTPSRRTGAKNIARLRAALKDLPAYVWDFQGDNPYHAILAHSDWLLVTCDSVNMVGEACFTSKPVYMLRLPGGSSKFARFHQNILSTRRVRWFEGELDSWPTAPLNATQEIAGAAAQAYLAKTGKLIA